MQIRPPVLPILLSLVAGLTASVADASDTTAAGAAARQREHSTMPEAPLHPLVGVVRDVRAERQALLVKHEEIPGFMRAMTMLLRVEPEVLARVKPGDAITAKLGRDADGHWFLRDVTVTAPAP